MAASTLIFNAEHRENDWTNFVSNVASCANTVNTTNTFDCLRSASSSDIYTGLVAAINEAPEQFAFPPTLDGENSLYPDIASRLLPKGHFARLPFIAGADLDEGKYSFSAHVVPCSDRNLGTIFTSPNIASEQGVIDSIIANFTPPVGASVEQLTDVAEQLIQLYPNVPALGSPYNTSNDTFGLSAVYKQAAAISWVLDSPPSQALQLTIHVY
jgi:acetylcholinesterase